MTIYVLYRRRLDVCYRWAAVAASCDENEFSDHLPRSPRLPDRCSEYVQEHRPREYIRTEDGEEMTAEQFAAKCAMYQEA